jgi:large conductance mechanosensitive channel
VDSVVNDLIMPLVSGIIGKPDFTNAYLVLKGVVPDKSALVEARKIPGTVIFAYGNFLTVAINFILLALIIFMMIKGINKLKKEKPTPSTAPVAPPPPTPTEQLLTEIRDELKKK